MNKKEVSEIRKLFSKDNGTIDRICGCYVDSEKTKKMVMKEAYLSLPQEEMLKYAEIFKKGLSGTIDKNLLNLAFPLQIELSGETIRGLRMLKDSALEDETCLEGFYDRIIETYQYPGNYLILLAHGNYDVPGKGSDHLDLFDASEEVYAFILCCICPVNLTKAGLCYNAEENMFSDRLQEWMVDMPETAFLYPAFNDRSSDLHGLLYYTKNPEEQHGELADELLGLSVPPTVKSQKDLFNCIVEETFGRDCDFEVAKSVHESLQTIMQESKDEPETPVLEKESVARILMDCGASVNQVEHLEKDTELLVSEEKEAKLPVSNLVSGRKFEVKSPDVTIRISPDRTDLIETRTIDGLEYLLIPMGDEVEVNGIRIRTGSGREENGEDAI